MVVVNMGEVCFSEIMGNFLLLRLKNCVHGDMRVFPWSPSTYGVDSGVLEYTS